MSEKMIDWSEVNPKTIQAIRDAQAEAEKYANAPTYWQPRPERKRRLTDEE